MTAPDPSSPLPRTWQPGPGLPWLGEDRWLVPIGLVWAAFALGATGMMGSVGAPPVTWGGSLAFALYGLWLGGLRLPFERLALRGVVYAIDADGLTITRGPRSRRVPLERVLAVRVDRHRDGSGTVWALLDADGAEGPARWEPLLRRVAAPHLAEAALAAKGASLT